MGVYGEIEDFAFTGRHLARDHESGHAVLPYGHSKIVVEIIGDAPVRSLGAGGLNGGDLLEVGWFTGADYCHIGDDMPVLLPLFFLFAQPFWEAKAPEMWTEQEINVLRTDSPWAQKVGPEPGVVVYLATAQPIEEAETELRVRSKSTGHEVDADYLAFLSANRGKCFVLAIPYDRVSGLEKAAESKKMEEESVMVIGKKQYHIAVPGQGAAVPRQGDDVAGKAKLGLPTCAAQ